MYLTISKNLSVMSVGIFTEAFKLFKCKLTSFMYSEKCGPG